MASSGFYTWSQTFGNNASADNSINWAEGMPPSAVNDSARAMMGVLAKNRDDISGAIVTSGTSTAYTVSSNTVFPDLASLANQVIAFTPHTTNADTVTLSVDGLTAKPLRRSPNEEVVAGTLVQGTPYTAIYNSSDGVFYLRGYFSSPFNVPFLGGLDYWDTVAPNSCFIFPRGQAISRTVYAKAFARWGTAFGSGDGSTTFNVPNKSGRVSAMTETSASLLTSTYFGGNSTNLGATGGGESHTLTLGELPTGINVSVSGNVSVFASGSAINFVPFTVGIGNSGNQAVSPPGVGSSSSPSVIGTVFNYASVFSGGNTLTGSSTNTSGNAHATVQPTITCNYIIRVL